MYSFIKCTRPRNEKHNETFNNENSKIYQRWSENYINIFIIIIIMRRNLILKYILDGVVLYIL